MASIKVIKSSQPLKKNPDHCDKCRGYGWWNLGDLTPFGEGDSKQWKGQTICCPFCNRGDIKTGDRYESLVKYKERLEREE